MAATTAATQTTPKLQDLHNTQQRTLSPQAPTRATLKMITDNGTLFDPAWCGGDALLAFCKAQPFIEYVYVGPNGTMANWIGEKKLKRAPKVEFYLSIWRRTPPSLSCWPALRASSPFAPVDAAVANRVNSGEAEPVPKRKADTPPNEQSKRARAEEQAPVSI